MKHGDRGDEVKALQRRLLEFGLELGPGATTTVPDDVTCRMPIL